MSQSPHEAYCQSLANQVDNRQEALATLLAQSSQQQPLEFNEIEQFKSEHLDLINHLHTSNCDFLTREIDHTPHDVTDPRTASLMFMIAATPSRSVADDLAAHFDFYRSRIPVTPSHDLQDNGPHYSLAGVPDTVNPIKAYLAYIQVPNGDRTDLKLVWKVSLNLPHTSALAHTTWHQLEVEMEDNWYEAAIDAVQPSHIISVVDWASDSSAAPADEDPLPNRAEYNVFPWGVNDPQEGNRTSQFENFDTLASPIGWHAIPAFNDPSPQGRLRSVKSGLELVNFTTTWGNNVSVNADDLAFATRTDLRAPSGHCARKLGRSFEVD